MEHNISIVGLAGTDAKLAIKVSPPISTSVSIGNPPNAETFVPTSIFRKVGKFPCKVRLTFRFRMRPWSAEISFPDGTPFIEQNDQGGGLSTPETMIVFIDFTTDSTPDET